MRDTIFISLKRPLWAWPVLFAALSASSWAQENPNAVTMAQVVGYQRGLQSSCERLGRLRGDQEQAVLSYCECVLTVFRFNASITDWQTAYFHFTNQQFEQEAKVLAPYKPKLARCEPPVPNKVRVQGQR